MTMRFSSPRSAGFTLVELLATVTIIVILLALVGPALDRLGPRQLDSAADSVAAELDFARVTALAMAAETEVRFYRQGESSASEDQAIRAFQTFVQENGKFVPRKDAVRLPQGIVINESEEFSPLAAESRFSQSAAGEDNSDQSNLANKAYFPIRFRTDGSVDLPRGSSWWGLTIQESRSKEDRVELPDNYVTIQVMPESGSLRVFQPK